MDFRQVEKLKHEYTDQKVVVDGDRPELLRFRGLVGQVKSINMSGRALVQFDGRGDMAWYDIELDYLKVLDPPDDPSAEAEDAPVGASGMVPPPPAAPQPASEPKPSQLELARQDKKPGVEKEPPREDAAPARPKRAASRKPDGEGEPVDPARLSALERARMKREGS